MSDFPLIKSLQSPVINDKTPLPKGHRYTKIQICVESVDYDIFIPDREVDDFNDAIKDRLSEYDFRQLLRKHRGIRG